jgi:hypothetical protein
LKTLDPDSEMADGCSPTRKGYGAAFFPLALRGLWRKARFPADLRSGFAVFGEASALEPPLAFTTAATETEVSVDDFHSPWTCVSSISRTTVEFTQ